MGKENSPLVSIIIPCYNHETYIEDCLSSIKYQTYCNIEVIIIDDCSCDNSFILLQNWKSSLLERFERVVINKNVNNLGITKTLNKAIELANGKYYKFIASDDMLRDDAIEKLVEFYESHTEYAIVYSNGTYINESIHFPLNEDIEEGKVFYEEPPLFGRDLFLNIYRSNFIYAPSVIIKAETMQKEGAFDEDIAYEDWEYWLRVSRANAIGYLDYKTVFYRISTNSMTHYKLGKEGEKKFEFMLENELKVLKKYNILPDCEEIIAQYCSNKINKTISLDYRNALDFVYSFIKLNQINISKLNYYKVIFYRIHLIKIFNLLYRIILFIKKRKLIKGKVC